MNDGMNPSNNGISGSNGRNEEMAQAQSQTGSNFAGIGEQGGTDLGDLSNVTGGTGSGGDLAGSAAGATSGADMEQDSGAGYGDQGSSGQGATQNAGEAYSDDMQDAGTSGGQQSQEELHQMGQMDDRARRMDEAMPDDVSDGSAGGAM